LKNPLERTGQHDVYDPATEKWDIRGAATDATHGEIGVGDHLFINPVFCRTVTERGG
jgi:hypothetical protein